MNRWLLLFVFLFAACSSGPRAGAGPKTLPEENATPVAPAEESKEAVDRKTVCRTADTAPDPNSDESRYVVNEALGGIKRFAKEAEVLAALGEPEKKSPEQEEGATGDMVSAWSWPNGVRATLSRAPDTQERVVSTIAVKAPSSLKTKLGIGIGSTLEAAKSVYAACMEPGQETSVARPAIIVGSPYDGLWIEADNNGVITSLALGGAE